LPEYQPSISRLKAEDQSSGPVRQLATRALGTCEEDDRRGMEPVQDMEDKVP